MDGRRLTRLLLACGAVGASLFVAVFLLDGWSRAGYRPTYHPVSALSLGDRGWLQIANFVVTGLLLGGFAVGVRRVLGAGRGARSVPVLLAGFAVALLLSGLFVMDPMRGYPPGTPAGDPAEFSWQHTVHDVAGVVVFVALPLAALVLATRFAKRPASPGWAWYSGVTGLAGLALLIAFGAAWESDHGAAGLVQRITILVGWSWLALLAFRLRAEVPAAGVATRVPAS